MPDQFGIKNDERQLSLIRSFHVSLSPVLNYLYYKLNFKSCFGSWLVKLTCSDTNRTLFQSFTILLRFFFIVLRRFNGPSLFDKNVNFYCHFMLILQRKTTQPATAKNIDGRSNTSTWKCADSSLSWNCVQCLTQKVLLSVRFYFYLLPNARFSKYCYVR